MIKMPRTFKTSAAAGINNYNADIPNRDKVGRFLWEILDSLREANVRQFANEFTLVNITHADTGKSIGVLDSPPIDTMDSPIAVTFLLRGKPDSYAHRATIYQNTRTWQIWGNGTRRFITLYFGRAIVNKHGMQFMLEPDLRLLWNIAGAITKVFMVNGVKDYAIPLTDVKQVSLYEQYSNRCSDFYSLVDQLPIQLWPYTQVFWEECSYLFDPRMLPNGFAAYWLFYLDSSVYMPTLSSTASQYITDMMSKVISDGLTVLSAAVSMQSQPSTVGQSMLFMFVYCLRALGIEIVGGSYTETEIASRKYVAGFCRAVQELPDFKQQFILYLSLGNTKAMGLDIYNYTTDIANTFLYLLDLSNKQFVGGGT